MNNVKDIFNSLRNEYMIIGLTGAIGSGCTSGAEFLSQEKVDSDKLINSIEDKNEFSTNYRRSKILKDTCHRYGWNRFYHIKVSNILFLILITSLNQIKKENEKILDIEIINNIKLKDILKTKHTPTDNELSTLIEICKNLSSNISEKKYKKETEENTDSNLNTIDAFINNYIDKENENYTILFQEIGKSIRKRGNIFNDSKSDIVELYKFDDSMKNIPVLFIAKIIREIIKLLDERQSIKDDEDKKFYVIDALRNTYEIEFFKNRYSSFYLLSILASQNIRTDRLKKDFNYTKDTLKDVIDFEKNSKDISSQDIDTCIGKGDIFINNDINEPSKHSLYFQLLKYISLIKNPGMFTPTEDEKYMQVAFTARYNSGCISRQVGAVVVGEDGYIRGLGWNDVPEGHISCLYRTPYDLLNNAQNMIFSEYERSTEFFDKINKLKASKKNLPFCFKDIRNEIEKSVEIMKLSSIDELKDNQNLINQISETIKIKNPTRERALHAEENAFLQVSKSGGQSVSNGTLFTTDSPCQLCAKKAMQLKISRIVYIDAYSDISTDQTLKSGEKEKYPNMEMFSGAIGTAYHRLYIPIIGLKDMFEKISKEN